MLNVDGDSTFTPQATSAGSPQVAAVGLEEEDDPYADAAIERPLPTKAGLYALVLAPPLVVALYDPSLFFAALDNAGTFGILTLFGIIPAWMTCTLLHGASNPTHPPNFRSACLPQPSTIILHVGRLPAVPLRCAPLSFPADNMRYGQDAEPVVPEAIPGGKITLGAMAGGATLVIALEIAEKFGVLNV